MTKKSRYNLNINSNYPALYQQPKALKAFTGGGAVIRKQKPNI